MAQVVTSDANVLPIFKTIYKDGCESLFTRNSPTLKKIKKERIEGRNYGFSMLLGRGGACSADYVRAVALATTGARNAEMLVPPAQYFSVFNLTQKEYLGSKRGLGAYVSALQDKMAAGTEAFRKQLGASVFGMGFGEICPVPLVNAGDSTMLIPDHGLAAVDVGTSFEVTTTSNPSSALVAGGPFAITAINGNLITFAPVAPAGGFALGSIMEFDGSRDAGGAANAPTGFGGWIPFLDDRAGAGWLAYIAVPFYGVNRSVSVQRLAGQFYTAVALESNESAIVNLIKLVRNAGGVPDLLVLNPNDYKAIIDNLALNVNYMQQINTSPQKSAENEFQYGLSQMGFQYSTNWIQYVIEDPLCPEKYGFVLDSAVVKLLSFTNTDILDDGIAGNNPGTQTVEQVGTAPVDAYRFNIEDYLDVRPGADVVDGPAARVTLSFFGNFCVTNPAHCGVVHFL